MSFVENMALGMIGLTDGQKTQVEAAVPQMTDIIQVVQANQAMLQQAYKLYMQSGPTLGTQLAELQKTTDPATLALLTQAYQLYMQAQPMITKILKDWQTVGPAVLIVAEAIKAKNAQDAEGYDG